MYMRLFYFPCFCFTLLLFCTDTYTTISMSSVFSFVCVQMSPLLLCMCVCVQLMLYKDLRRDRCSKGPWPNMVSSPPRPLSHIGPLTALWQQGSKVNYNSLARWSVCFYPCLPYHRRAKHVKTAEMAGRRCLLQEEIKMVVVVIRLFYYSNVLLGNIFMTYNDQDCQIVLRCLSFSSFEPFNLDMMAVSTCASWNWYRDNSLFYKIESVLEITCCSQLFIKTLLQKRQANLLCLLCIATCF